MERINNNHERPKQETRLNLIDLGDIEFALRVFDDNSDEEMNDFKRRFDAVRLPSSSSEAAHWSEPGAGNAIREIINNTHSVQLASRKDDLKKLLLTIRFEK